MPDLDNNTVALSSHLCNLRGGSQPILARASDGLEYVVKFADNPQGPNLLFNESMGSELFRACGLAVPEWKPLLVTDAFLDRNPACWMQTPQGPRRPHAGWCFGSRYLGGDGVRLLEILPGNSFQRVSNQGSFWLAWLLDICAGHADNRQAIFRQSKMGKLDAYFVDFGHLFGGPKGELNLPFRASRYLDARIYANVSSQYLLNLRRIVRCLDAVRLEQAAVSLPGQWKTATAQQGFARCMDRLSSPAQIEQTLDAMLHSIQQGHRREQSRRQDGGEFPLSILRFGVQAAGVGKGCIGERAGHLACA
jgi:hypothetical protein